jgi:hypothetical protein
MSLTRMLFDLGRVVGTPGMAAAGIARRPLVLPKRSDTDTCG